MRRSPGREALAAPVDTPRVTLRPMTPEEFGPFRARGIEEYAAAHVAAGSWAPSEATGRAAIEFDTLLPDGLGTPAMLLLVAEIESAVVVGRVWVALETHDDRESGWIYDIEIVEEHRGRGLGKALLAATELAAADHGASSIGLNVFADNAVAWGMYERAGYAVTTAQMRKLLPADR